MKKLSVKRSWALIGNVLVAVFLSLYVFRQIVSVAKNGVIIENIIDIIICSSVITVSILSAIKNYTKVSIWVISMFIIYDIAISVIDKNLYFSFSSTFAACIIAEIALIVSTRLKDEQETDIDENQKDNIEKTSPQIIAPKLVIEEEGKNIVKTKILETKERETAANKRKGRWLSAFAAGMSAGFGGDRKEIMFAGHSQDARNAKNAKYETVITFLIIYDDNSRKTVDVIKGDENYNQLIMYLE